MSPWILKYQKHVNLRVKGSGLFWIGLSPFRKEKTPSFTVNACNGNFHDFCLGIGGTYNEFIEAIVEDGVRLQ